MADLDVVDKKTEQTEKIMRESKDGNFSEADQQEAYFELLQIFSYAQATGDYARFQADIEEWKRRYPLDFFDEEYRIKIKYMLKEEFMEKVLKGILAYIENSKKDFSKGLDKMHKIFDAAEKHKDGKKLDKDLDELYVEYPLRYLKDKYPHIVSQLLRRSYREKVLLKFDSASAYAELKRIVDRPQDYTNSTLFLEAVEEWEKLYPIKDFNDKVRPDVEKTLAEYKDQKKLDELYPSTPEPDLSQGEVIFMEESPKYINKINRDALHDFTKIVGKDAGNIDALFRWLCKYSKYINSFDEDSKNLIVKHLMNKYSHELPTDVAQYRIPSMDVHSDGFLSKSDYDSIGKYKKDSILQLLGMLSTGQALTHDDNYRLGIINGNVQKANNIYKVDEALDIFENLAKKHPNIKLTDSDEIYVNASSKSDNEVEVKATKPINLGFTKVSSSSSSSSSNNGGGGFSAGVQMDVQEEPPAENEDEKDDKNKCDKDKKDEGIVREQPNLGKFFIPLVHDTNPKDIPDIQTEPADDSKSQGSQPEPAHDVQSDSHQDIPDVEYISEPPKNTFPKIIPIDEPDKPAENLQEEQSPQYTEIPEETVIAIVADDNPSSDAVNGEKEQPSQDEKYEHSFRTFISYSEEER